MGLKLNCKGMHWGCWNIQQGMQMIVILTASEVTLILMTKNSSLSVSCIRSCTTWVQSVVISEVSRWLFHCLYIVSNLIILHLQVGNSEFQKINKPRVQHIESSSTSAKASRESYTQVQSIHTYEPVKV